MTKKQKNITIVVFLAITALCIGLDLAFPEFFSPIGEGYVHGVSRWFGW